MKVRELIVELLKYNLDDIVIVAENDANNYSPLDGTSDGRYDADTTWSGQYGLKEISDEDRLRGYTDEDIGSGEDCVVLWPIH